MFWPSTTEATFATDLFGITGAPSRADLSRMRQAKSLVYEGLRHVAGKAPFGREGVLVDEELGADVVRAAKSDGVVVLMPIERSGSESVRVGVRRPCSPSTSTLRPDFFKALVRYNPADDEGSAANPDQAPGGRVRMGGTDEPALDHGAAGTHPHPKSDRTVQGRATSTAPHDRLARRR